MLSTRTSDRQATARPELREQDPTKISARQAKSSTDRNSFRRPSLTSTATSQPSRRTSRQHNRVDDIRREVNIGASRTMRD